MEIIINLVISLFTNYFTAYTYDLWKSKESAKSDYVPIILVMEQKQTNTIKRHQNPQLDYRAVNRTKLGVKLTQILLFLFTSLSLAIALYVPIMFLQGLGKDEFNLETAKITGWILHNTVSKSSIYYFLVIVGIILFVPVTRLSDFLVQKVLKFIDNYEVVTFETWIKTRATVFGIISFIIFGLQFYLWSDMDLFQSYLYAVALLVIAFGPVAEDKRR